MTPNPQERSMYEARSIDAIYLRYTLESAITTAIHASSRTGESCSVWLADGTYWATIGATAKRGNAIIQLVEYAS